MTYVNKKVQQIKQERLAKLNIFFNGKQERLAKQHFFNNVSAYASVF